MKNYIRFTASLLLLAIGFGAFYSCTKKATAEGKEVAEENLIIGSNTIWVDNTIQPIIEDELAVFHSIYDRAHITQVNKTENELLNAFAKDSAKILVMARKLTAAEEASITKAGLVAQVTPFATDAIALITNKKAADTVMNLEEVFNVLQGKESAKIKSIVFDNANSSTIQYLLKQAGVKNLPSANVYSLKTNEEVIKYVNNNAGSIGIVGVNWLLQPPLELTQIVENIQVLAVDNVKIDKGVKKYYSPSQSNIATGSYPLTRKLYVLNYQGKQGLGMGFANYISAPDGQRIVLKSGLLPETIPTREIEVRNEL
jgi:phosphate transport system substrate-binding protein